MVYWVSKVYSEDMGETKTDAISAFFGIRRTSHPDTDQKFGMRTGPINMSEETTNISTFDALIEHLLAKLREGKKLGQ
jgi:hypothetical protein